MMPLLDLQVDQKYCLYMYMYLELTIYSSDELISKGMCCYIDVYVYMYMYWVFGPFRKIVFLNGPKLVIELGNELMMFLLHLYVLFNHKHQHRCKQIIHLLIHVDTEYWAIFRHAILYSSKIVTFIFLTSPSLSFSTSFLLSSLLLVSKSSLQLPIGTSDDKTLDGM